MIREFPLRMADGAMVRTLVELRSHFDLDTVVTDYKSGRLERWLRSEGYPEHADRVAALDPESEDLGAQLRTILFTPEARSQSVPVPRTTSARLARIRKYTQDPDILASVDDVAFTQEELEALVADGAGTVYLCGERFVAALPEQEVEYVGVNRPLLLFPPECAPFIYEGALSCENVEMDFGNVFDVVTEAVSRYPAMYDEVLDKSDETAFGYAAFFMSDFPYGLDLARDAAEEGDVRAMILLGDMFRLVLGGREEAYEAYKDAYDRGSIIGVYKVGCCFREGFGVAKNVRKGIKLITQAAEAGCEMAQMHLGIEYSAGDGVKHNEVEACKWFARAAEQGNVLAQFDLGLHYLEGVGVKKDYKTGFEWTRKAAQQGYAIAQTQLGIMYEMGVGTRQDPDQAAHWFSKAAEQGDAAAQFELARHYLRRGGSAEDRKNAVSLLVQSAAQGNEDAELLLRELTGVESDEEEEDQKAGPDDTIVALKGLMERAMQEMSEEEGLTPDQEKRLNQEIGEWYEKRASKGDLWARCVIEVIKKADVSFATMLDNPYFLYLDMAEAEFAPALLLVAQCQCLGESVRKDEQNAIRLYKEVSTMYDPTDPGAGLAEYCLGLLYGSGLGARSNWETASRWFRKGARLGVPDAAYALSLCYEAGLGVKQSEAKADTWRKRAEQGGYQENVTLPKGLDKARTRETRAQKIADLFSDKALERTVSRQMGVPLDTVTGIFRDIGRENPTYKSLSKCMKRVAGAAHTMKEPNDQLWAWKLLCEMWVLQQLRAQATTQDVEWNCIEDIRDEIVDGALDE